MCVVLVASRFGTTVQAGGTLVVVHFTPIA